MWLAFACPKNLPETKLKSFRLMVLAEVSRQPSVDFVMWLLVVTFMQIYNEKEQVGQREI